MKYLILLLLVINSVCYATTGTLPDGFIGRVQNNVANQYATYNYTFTPTVSGSQYIMFAFRQDPAYWTLDNVSVKASGSNTNLLTNSNFDTGGDLTVTVNGGTQSIAAPTAWGVSYQSGIYPSAAGFWTNGTWYDGAVGSFDGIYQGLTLTAGVTYTITFSAMSNNVVSTALNGPVNLGIYAGSCASLTLNASSCNLPTTSGFSTLATPIATYTTGCTNNCPVAPTPTSTYNSNITIEQQARVTSFSTRAVSGNSVYINNTGSDNVISVAQIGRNNKLNGIGQASIPITGSNNSVIIRQGAVANSTDKNQIEMKVVGSNNSINANQGVTTTGQSTNSTNNQYQSIDVYGNDNVFVSQQTNNGGVGGHYMESSISGNNNTVTNKQLDNANKIMFTNVNGNYNTVDATQKGTGQHYLDLSLTGNNNSATVLQEGVNQNKATIDLTNAGGASTINLNQNSASAGQVFNIMQSCVVSGGCSASITQQ